MKIKVYVIDLEIPAKAKKWGLRIAIPLGVLLGGGAIAWAAGLHTWNTGDTLNATDLNGNFSQLQNEITTLQGEPASAVNAASFSFSTNCAAVTGVPTAVDCTCAGGEIAVSGGGYCGPSANYLWESANAGGAGARTTTGWRVNCSSTAPRPGNAYALCLKTQ